MIMEDSGNDKLLIDGREQVGDLGKKKKPPNILYIL